MRAQANDNWLRLAAICAATFTALAGTLLTAHYAWASSAIITPLSSTTAIAGNYHLDPITSSNSAPPPLVMLTLSRDHQLSLKAYNDYSDLKGNGKVELTYDGSILYYGYFDPKKCYTYGSGYFSPAEMATISTDSGGNQTTVYCNRGTATKEWSGNFLNWGTMTRMDVVRKLLYGGMRSTDTGTQTILERNYLPTDAHAFAKYYNGTDIAKLTPFTTTNTTAPTTTYTFGSGCITAPAPTPGAALSGSCVSATDPTVNPKGVTYSSFTADVSNIKGVGLGDQVEIDPSTGSGPSIQGTIRSLSTSGSVTTAEIWVLPNGWTGSGDLPTATITDRSLTGITLCNMTSGELSDTSNPNHLSHSNTNPPQIRVANGNYQFWGTSEKWQCYWSGEKNYTQEGFNASLFSNGNRVPYSGLLASAENPDQTVRGMGTGDTAGASSNVGQYIARVKACVPGLIGSERCKIYPTTNTTYSTGVQKPIGLLQVYGESNLMSIGLVTPTYQNNVSGGVLRKNVGTFGDEVNASTDGTYTSTKGIVYNINHLRQYGYDYAQPDNYNWNGCPYQRTGIAVGTGGSGTVVSEGNCASWGNPMGEAYVEGIRYFAGLTPTTAFGSGNTSGADQTLGLTVASWSDPLSSTNYCASLNQLVLNSSVSSYDDDQAVTPFATLFGSPDLNAWTNKVGDGESITGNNFLIGSNGTTSDQLCTAKSITSLATASGLCPEAPVLHGSYFITGAAYYAHTKQIRDSSKLSVPSTDITSLKLTTYGVALATNVPKITVAIPGSTTNQKVVIQPAYQLTLSSTATGQGTLVDFKPITLAADGSSGSYYVNWEDSTQGGDFDQDVWGILSYTVTSSSITVTTKVISQSTANPQGFGYVISGTNHDGVHFHSGILGYTFTDPSGVISCGGTSGCNVADPATSVTYSFSAGAASSFNDPLWYAAKYGGFIDYDNNGTPVFTTPSSHTYPNAKWDSFNQNGTANPAGDGIPDNFYYVTNPAALETSLQAAFQTILGRTASGTAAAVVANQREGDGATYQALYEGKRSDTNGAAVSWIGTVQGLFVDFEGNLREDDAAHDATLHPTDFSRATGNAAVQIVYDPSTNSTEFRRYADGCDPSAGCTSFALDSLDQLNTIWNARVSLANMTNTSTGTTSSPLVASNRTFTSTADTGRYIFTSIDSNLSGTITPSKQVAFDISSFTASTGNTYGILNVNDVSSATNLISYIRGQDQTGLRNRTIDYGPVNGTDAGSRSYILGDIVDSTPAVVGTPAEAFDLLYKDQTYAAFRKDYRRRRNVVYVGANDGMLHAFNGGFYNQATTSFALQGDDTSVPKHPLGSELWAYVPFNLLPHLGWLTSSQYAHVFYMDGAPRVFDAHIFSDTADCTPKSDTTPQNCHPYGWATILVAGMRFGGGELALNPCNGTSTATQFTGFSGFNCATATPTVTTHSAYVVMDVTNPEEPPVVLAEITDSTPLKTGVLGFTTAFPSPIAFAAKAATTSSPQKNDSWYLLFGNGPSDVNLPGDLSNAGAGAAQDATLSVYQLNSNSKGGATGCPATSPGLCDTIDLVTDSRAKTGVGSTASTSFLGDPVAVDWQLTFQAANAYFGIATGSGATANQTPSGALIKVDTAGSATTSGWTLSTLVNPGLPILDAPSVTFDPQNHHWVYAGTGRYYVVKDKYTPGEQQALFGVIDGKTTPTYSSLTDVTGAQVKVSDLSISGVKPAITCTGSACESVLEKAVVSSLGWKIQLNADNSTTNDIAERSVSSSAVFGGTLLATAFTPNTSQCLGNGSSRLFGLNYLTGVANPTNPALGINPSANAYYANYLGLGPGFAAAPALHANTSNGASGLITVVTQTSTGAINLTNANVSSGGKSSEIDWRQTHPNTGP